ncbi:hypothetical protein NE237_006948 [Protea cynaroides]|uniref:Uncharacterized protein n=1 Tax=Protea cynaroides TaxID=273540 RepID=A0A9Q0KNK5_9MAGN|nr:hypothetical protein NE237_006948 [Protea cynaroides]
MRNSGSAFYPPCDGEILCPSLKENYIEDNMRFVGWFHDEMKHFMLGRSSGVLAIVRAFGDHRIGSRAYHSYKVIIFLFCIYSIFLLCLGARGASPPIIDVVHQLKKGYDLILIVLVETMKGLDVMKETFSIQGPARDPQDWALAWPRTAGLGMDWARFRPFAISMLDLQVWICMRSVDNTGNGSKEAREQATD